MTDEEWRPLTQDDIARLYATPGATDGKWSYLALAEAYRLGWEARGKRDEEVCRAEAAKYSVRGIEAAACRGALLYAEDAIARDGKEKP